MGSFHQRNSALTVVAQDDHLTAGAWAAFARHISSFVAWWKNLMDINPTKKSHSTIELIPDEDICARFVLVFLTVCSIEIKPTCQS